MLLMDSSGLFDDDLTGRVEMNRSLPWPIQLILQRSHTIDPSWLFDDVCFPQFPSLLGLMSVREAEFHNALNVRCLAIAIDARYR